MNVKLSVWAVSLLVVLSSSAVKAQEKGEVSVGADIVSGYIWRGQDCGGVSIQPSLSVAKSGFSLTAWGSVGIDGDDVKELDLILRYDVGGFSVSVTDLWFDKVRWLDNAPRFFDFRAKGPHKLRARLRYDFGPVAFSWDTNFAGYDYYSSDGKRSYSTYVEAVVPFKLGGLDFAAEVGATPWEGAYADDLNVTNIGLGASKKIKITDSFSLPTFAKLITNPFEDKTYFVFGLTF